MNAPAVQSTTIQEPSLSETAVTGVQQGDKVMPIYLLLDVSGSMHDVEEDLNKVAAELKQLAADEPEVADVAHICIIVFNGSAQVLVPLSDIREATVPRVTTGGGTNYGAAFELLKDTIDADFSRYQAAGAAVFRPLAWLLSDGAPQDDSYESRFIALFHYDPATGSGNKRYPRLVPIGFRQARLDVLTKLAYPPQDGLAYLSQPGTSAVVAFRAILDFICKTTVSTGKTVTAPGGPRHEFPESLPGFDQAPSQYAGGDWLS